MKTTVATIVQTETKLRPCKCGLEVSVYRVVNRRGVSHSAIECPRCGEVMVCQKDEETTMIDNWERQGIE